MEESEARQWLGEALSIFSDIAEAYGRQRRPGKRQKLMAGVSGESTPPSSHLMLTKSSPLETVLSLVTVPGYSKSFLT
jgi:hypothetical protein